jgi:hypothetical protein
VQTLVDKARGADESFWGVRPAESRFKPGDLQNHLKSAQGEKRKNRKNMATTTSNRPSRTFGANSINIALGIWLILAPFILGYHLSVAVWNDIILGIVIGAIALLRTYGVNPLGMSWVNVVLGIWLIIAPFVLNFGNEPAARWNDIIVGLLVVIFAWSNTAISRPPADIP